MRVSKRFYRQNFNNGRNRIIVLYAAVIAYLFLAFSTLLSCSSEDSEIPAEVNDVGAELAQPTIELVSGSNEIINGVIGAPGIGNMNHSLKAQAPEGFAQLVIYKVVNGVPSEYQTVDTTHPDYEVGSNEFIYELSYIFTEYDANNNLHFIAELSDEENQIVTLEFAEAEVKKPLKYIQEVFIETRIPIEPNNYDIAQFLSTSNNSVEGVNLNTILENNLHQSIAAIISFNEVQGVYISSTTEVDYTQTVDDIAYLSDTKFKEIDFNSPISDEYNIYDTFTIIALYEDSSFNANNERALNLAEKDVFVMRTDDDKTALFQINYFEITNNGEVNLSMDFYITQN